MMRKQFYPQSFHQKDFFHKKLQILQNRNGRLFNYIKEVMNTLEPAFLNPSKRSFQSSGKTKRSISIFKSKRAIVDLQESIEHENQLQDSLLLTQNRQITSGMILDVNKYHQSSKVQKHLIAKDGETDQKVFFSFLVLKQQDGLPTEVIYRWIRKLAQAPLRSSEVVITEEEHIYKGHLKDNRKHGSGQYIILRKFSNTNQSQIRYTGEWLMDIFNCGTIQDQSGVKKQLNHSNFLTLKSRRQVKGGRTDRNETIKLITDEMNKRKSSKVIRDRNSNASSASILDRIRYRQEPSIHNIKA